MTARPIALPWHCQRSGDCCHHGPVMTQMERETIVAQHPEATTLPWSAYGPDHIRLQTQPCAFLVEEALQTTSCSIYAWRPYNCRRFGCFRPDVHVEPFEAEGPLGCRNLSDRVTQSRAVRRAAVLLQRRAQPWALAHGWTMEMITHGE